MRCTVPVIASGGVGTLDHLVEGVREGHASAVLAASIFHYGEHTIGDAKRIWLPPACRSGSMREADGPLFPPDDRQVSIAQRYASPIPTRAQGV